MKVRDVMTHDVVTVAPDASVKHGAAVLAEKHVSGLPVVDSSGAVVGVLSETDVVVKGHDAALVADAMTAPAVTIASDRAVDEAAVLMVKKDINRLPVVDGDRLVGIVSRADLVRAFTRSDEELAEEIREEVLVQTLFASPRTVDVTVKEGRVVLRGWLEDERAARAASAIVERIPGVVAVESHLGWRTRDPEAPN